MNSVVIKPLREIHARHRLTDGSVSEHTKSAITITMEWQVAVRSKKIGSEVSVSPENNEKIDVIDFCDNTAYELKVSGKNTHHEFYKDVAKVLTFNEYHDVDHKIRKLVFISESSGISSLKRRLDIRFLKMLENKHDLTIELVSI